MFDESEILRHLPPTMASELVYCMYEGMIKKCPLFRELPAELVEKICVLLQPYKCTVGEVIMKEDTVGRDLYLILIGKVLITNGGQQRLRIVSFLRLLCGRCCAC